jgi:legumain
MNVYILLLLALMPFAYATDKSDHWAVIVAGSDGFWNYRHQADVCHAYQIMKTQGIPEDQIILLSYDDVASASQNPFPGKLFNKPDGEDVYAGCNIDYRGSDVTPKTFLDVIKGTGSGKVLKSNKDSKVFINFADHGAPGLIAFPSGQLYAKDLHEALLYMNKNEMYGEMTLYIEACESGSMFDGILEENLNIYATTAANPSESSWGYYCSPDDTVQGTHIGSCLGDLYSINWMEDTDSHNICSETLDEQFETILAKTTKSHVMKYGDMSFTSEVVGNFQGVCDTKATLSSFLRTLDKKEDKKEYASINSRDAKMDYLYNKYMRTLSAEDGQELQDEITHRTLIDMRFSYLSANVGFQLEEHPRVNDFECYKGLVESYKSECGGLDEYDLKFLGHFVNMCNAQMEPTKMLGLINEMC